jgi:hypothetical protein
LSLTAIIAFSVSGTSTGYSERGRLGGRNKILIIYDKQTHRKKREKKKLAKQQKKKEEETFLIWSSPFLFLFNLKKKNSKFACLFIMFVYFFAWLTKKINI